MLDTVRQAAGKANSRRQANIPMMEWILRQTGSPSATAGPLGEGEDWVEAAINEEIFADALDTCRTKQSAGSDGWQCILLRWAPRWLQEAYRQSLAQVVRERQYPPEWREWFVTMIPKAKRDPSLFKNLRDIWLVPHGWKIVTACFSAEYKRVNAETQPHAAHGFRQLRNAAQASLVVKLQTEEAAILCQPLVRMYFDLEGFFMGVVRAVLLELEK